MRRPVSAYLDGAEPDPTAPAWICLDQQLRAIALQDARQLPHLAEVVAGARRRHRPADSITGLLRRRRHLNAPI
jgi:hypothetical protein